MILFLVLFWLLFLNLLPSLFGFLFLSLVVLLLDFLDVDRWLRKLHVQ